MATSRLEWLKTQRDRLRTLWESQSATLQIDYSIDGQSESIGTATNALYEQIKDIEAEIALLENGGEWITEGYSA
jgi:hypothetical protein